jgi:3-dehydroquinate synthase
MTNTIAEHQASSTITLSPKQQEQPESLIVIGQGILDTLESLVPLSDYTARFILTDQNVYADWVKPLAERIGASVIQVPSGEQHKVLSSVEYVCRCLMKGRADRKALLINVGGGLIGDLGGFAASVYMRGIDFVQVPTTLLSQVDASVGGKTGVNLESVKNMIGAFQQPVAVLVDVNTLKTLPKRELLSGFAEILKHGIIADEAYFEWVVSSWQAGSETFDWVQCVEKSCHIKAAIVSADEKEAGARKLLNLGHTIGHAFEAASYKTESPLLHGEAIALGLVAEAHLAERTGIAAAGTCERISEAFKALGLPTSIEAHFVTEELMAYVHSDKKNLGDRILWSLPTRIGQAVIDAEVELELVEEALKIVQR